MYEVIWYWFVAIMEGVVSLKMRIVECIAYKSKNSVSSNGAAIRFQYFLIYFN